MREDGLKYTEIECILITGLERIIAMNRRQGRDQYGDAEKAESWGCVTEARKFLALARERKLLAPTQGDSVFVDAFLADFANWMSNDELPEEDCLDMVIDYRRQRESKKPSLPPLDEEGGKP
jgi:hypothetical protein